MATNTAASFTNHTGNGTAGPFSISFPYLSEAEVDVTVGGVLKTITTHYTFSSATQITFTSGNEPGNGVAIKFQRDTDISAKKVDFQDGSVLTETDLDTNADQVIFAQQEIIDKLGGIEENATADQTAAEIRTLVGDATDSNVFTDAEKTKLTGIDTNAKDDQTASEIKTLIASSPLDASHLAANSVNTSKLANDSVTYSKLQNVSATDRVLGRDSSGAGVVEEITPANLRTMINVEDGATADQTNAEIKTAYEANSNTNAFTDAEKTKLTSVETNAKDDQSASEIKTLYESNSNTNALTDAEKTVIDGVTANTSELNKLDGFTGSTADLNQVSGMSKQTTITNSDSHFPTSGAVVDFVANQIAPVGGLEVIADEDNFPATQPVSGVVISISNADGLVINSSGVATNARTVGSGSDNVTINNFPTSLRSKTLSNELGLLVSSTGASQIYNYHKLLAKETDVLQLSEDINDFGNRYRVLNTLPNNSDSSNHDGDLVYAKDVGKIYVYSGDYDGTPVGTFGEVQSIGNFFISTLSPAFNGSVQDFTITNAPSNAQQIILSINGVIQKPNAGTSTPSEGFALSGSTVKLAAAPASGSDYFAIVLGSTVNIGTPSNNTVTSAMIVDGSIVNGDISNSADIAGSKLNLVSTSSTAGIIVKGDGSSDGYLQLNCSQNSHGIKLKSPPHSANQNYTLTFPSAIVNGAFLKTDANGNLSFAAVNTDLVNDTSPQLGGNLASNGNNIIFADTTGASNNRLVFGANTDMSIYHEPNNNYIDADTGTLHIRHSGETGAKFIKNGAVELYYNNGKKFETTSGGARLNGILSSSITSGQAITLADNAQIHLGTGDDLKIYHDGSNSVITAGNAGDLQLISTFDDVEVKAADNIFLRPKSGEDGIKVLADAGVELYHDNTIRFETATYGVNVPSSGSSHGFYVHHGNGNEVARLVHGGSGDEGYLGLRDSGTTTVQLTGENGQNCFIAGPRRLRFGTSSADPSASQRGGMLATTTTGNPVFIETSSAHYASGTYTHIYFYGSGGGAGGININGSSTSYTTSSDYRLKENVVPLTNAITRLKTLLPKRFNWIADETNTMQDGFLAHEVTAVPEAVSGTKDEMKSLYYEEGDTIPDGKAVGDFKEFSTTEINPQQIDTGKLIPLLTAALQEAVAKIETLETKVAALEAT